MIKGTVSVMSSGDGALGLRFGDLVSIVCVGGKECYTLSYFWGMLMNSPRYTLRDLEGGEIRSWIFKQRMLKMEMDVGLEPDFPMQYLVSLTGGRYFVTPTEKIPTYFKVAETSQSIEVDGMYFEHRDYQDKISFHCEPERMEQAIIVANVLFTPPLSEQ